MIWKTIFLLLNIFMLMFMGGNICHATQVNSSVDIQIKNQDLSNDDGLAIIVNPDFATHHPKCILSENTEENQPDPSYIKLSPFDTFTFYMRSKDFEKCSRSETYGLLAGNMLPAQHVSRQILFHSLQFYF